MKIDLPQENWNDLAEFVPRSQLGQIVPQIGDRHFAWIIQSFLHEFGQISSGKFRIEFPMNGNAPVIYTDEDMGWPLPDVPMPSNIVNFKEIHLCYFDESVLDFLRQFQLNSQLSSVNLEFKECKSGALMAFLTKFMPLIESVDSITDIGQSFVSLLEHSELANTLLTSARVFDILAKNVSNSLIGNWLTTPRADGKPRLLFLKPYRYYDFFGDETETINECSSLIEYIKQDFMHAKQAASFYIKIVGFDFDDMRKVLASLSLNIKTGEKLVITKIEVEEDSEDFDLIISRIPIGTNEEEWHHEMAQYSDSNSDNRWDNVGQYSKKEYRGIVIDI